MTQKQWKIFAIIGKLDEAKKLKDKSAEEVYEILSNYLKNKNLNNIYIDFYGNEKIDDDEFDCEDFDEMQDETYHGTREDRDEIINNGFNTNSVYISDSKNVSLGYGSKLIAIKDLEKELKIAELKPDELDKDDNYRREKYKNYDGIKYRYGKNRPYSFQIFNVKKLNNLKMRKVIK